MIFFFGGICKSIENKSKNKQVGPHQTKKHLYSKVNNQQNEKMTYETGESVCILYLIGVNI